MSYIGNLDTHRGLIGKLGEDIACEYLEFKGHLIVERNYRIKFGEIDIISKLGNGLHFIEVKTVKSSNTTPEEHIDRKKISKMKKLADLYFNDYSKNLTALELDNEDITISLDFLGVTLNADNTKKKITFIESLEV
jgi:putative endonuclease